MTAILTLPDCRSRRSATALLILSLCAVALSDSPAHAQRRGSTQRAAAGAGQAVAGAITDTVADSMVACAIGPLIAMAQIAEIFNEITVEILHVPVSQVEKLLSVNADMKAKLDVFKALPIRERHEKMMAALPVLEKEYVARINEHLDAERRVIFRNLLLNIHGPTSFAEPDIAATLSLTKEQRTKVAETLADSESRLKRSVGIDREFGALDIAGILGIRKKRDAALLALLTPEQQEAWIKLKGPPSLDVEASIKKIAAAQLARLLAKPNADSNANAAESPPAAPSPSAPSPPSANSPKKTR